jgi:hypothetical protein
MKGRKAKFSMISEGIIRGSFLLANVASVHHSIQHTLVFFFVPFILSFVPDCRYGDYW